jgi:hypothetical protein
MRLTRQRSHIVAVSATVVLTLVCAGKAVARDEMFDASGIQQNREYS